MFAERCVYSRVLAYMWQKSKKSALILVLLLAICGPTLSQSKPAGAGKSLLCARDNAFEMIKLQIGLTKTFGNPITRITVLIRAADLLWPHEQKQARAVFKEAFQLATEIEKENDEKGPRSIILRLQVPDQRLVVIRAVAKCDSALAKELTRQMLKPDTDELSTPDSFKDLLTAEKLLHAAYQMVPTDLNGALDLARTSLDYPVSSFLTHFLYRFAQVDQQGADQFYRRALAIYAGRPMREFLYLQAYPFGWHETQNTPVVPNYAVPANFLVNKALQRAFIEILLRRAQQAVEASLNEDDRYRSASVDLLPANVHLLHGLIRLDASSKRIVT